MGRGQRTARERLPSTVSAEHRDFTLETQRLGGSGKIGSCDNTFEMTPSPRCQSVFYHSRKVSHCPSTQTLAEGGQPRGAEPASMPGLTLADPPECPFFIFLPIAFQLFSSLPTPMLMLAPSNSCSKLDCLLSKAFHSCPPAMLLFPSHIYKVSARCQQLFLARGIQDTKSLSAGSLRSGGCWSSPGFILLRVLTVFLFVPLPICTLQEYRAQTSFISLYHSGCSTGLREAGTVRDS